MKYAITVITKNQPGNGFLKMTPRDKVAFEKELQDRLFWLCQLSGSKLKKDQDIYKALTQIGNAMFGRAPQHGNTNNTGLSALAGALDKLRRGDLSEKQKNNIQPVLDLMHQEYPDRWSKIEYEETNLEEVKEVFDSLFEQVANSVDG